MTLAFFCCIFAQDLSFATEGVREAWFSRETSHNAISITWRQETTHIYVPEKIETDGSFAAALDGSRRYSFDVLNYGSVGEAPQRAKRVVDAAGERTSGGQAEDISSASITKDTSIRLLRLLPIAIVYFPFRETDDPWLLDRSDLSNPVAVKLDGADCLLFESKKRSSMIWVLNDGKYFPPVRFVKNREDGKLRYDFRMRTSVTQNGQLQLEGWTFRNVAVDGKTLIESTDVSVTVCTIDAPFEEGEFEYDLQHGTWVNDNVRGKMYLARDGEPDRLLEAHHSTDDYDKLMSTANGTDIHSHRNSGIMRKVLLWGNLVVFGVLILAYIKRRGMV